MKLRSGIKNPDPLDVAIREALKRAMADSGKSRAQIAEELTARLNREKPITESMLSDFVAISVDKMGARLPAYFIPALCETLGTDEPLRLLFTPEIKALVILGECDLAEQTKRRDKAKILAELSNMPKYRSVGDVR